MIRIMGATYNQESFRQLSNALNISLFELKGECDECSCATCVNKIVCYDLQSAILFCNKKLAKIPDYVENPVENVEN